MKEILHAIHKSIAERPPNYNDAESLLDMLFWHYTESNALDNEKIKEQFDALRKSVPISREEYDDFFYIVCSLPGAWQTGLYRGTSLGCGADAGTQYPGIQSVIFALDFNFLHHWEPYGKG